ncbi:acetate/propionate family kinase [Natronospora cellulosivora (SeqCode)]
MNVFVLNSGGSSVKFKFLKMPEEELLASGKVERLGKEDAIFHFAYGNNEVKRSLSIKNHKEAIFLILKNLIDKDKGIINTYNEIDAVGHRVVHAGEKFTASVVIDDQVINAIKECFDLAPLHNPPNVTGIEIFKDILPDTKMVAVFDNAFHVDIEDYVRTYAIPYKYYEKYGVRRYGFHGITFEYMTGKAAEILDRNLDDLKLVSLMMGSGCTANAFKEGKSVEVSTGFTPLEGLVQSTRSGDLDPAAILYIMKKENLSAEEMDRILNKESGWLGISGVSNDLREIIEESDKGVKLAKLALETTAHRAKKYVGAYSAVMGGIDALVFSGGVGENCALLREKIVSELKFLGLEIDEDLNNNLSGEGIISTKDSSVKIIVVNTDEEVVIARDTYTLVRG